MGGEKKKILLAAGGVTILIGFLGWFSFFWQTGSIGNKFEEIQRVKLESLVWQEKVNQASILKRELPQIEEESQTAEKMFVSGMTQFLSFSPLKRRQPFQKLPSRSVRLILRN